MLASSDVVTSASLKFAVASNDIERAQSLAADLQGVCYTDARESWQHLPFRALCVGLTDDFSAVQEAADVGLYLVCERVIKPGQGEVFGLFPMVHNAQLTHVQADAHWRDKHGPLALEHHIHMTHYLQLAAVHRFNGPDFDGFALCGFANEKDLRERFYTTKESVKVIAADVQTFADPKGSPPRLIARPTRYHTND